MRATSTTFSGSWRHWLEAEFGNMKGLVEDLKNKYEDEINKCSEMESEVVLIKKDVDEVYKNKVELESRLEGLTDETDFYRQMYEEETRENFRPRSLTRPWCCP